MSNVGKVSWKRVCGAALIISGIALAIRGYFGGQIKTDDEILLFIFACGILIFVGNILLSKPPMRREDSASSDQHTD